MAENLNKDRNIATLREMMRHEMMGKLRTECAIPYKTVIKFICVFIYVQFPKKLRSIHQAWNSLVVNASFAIPSNGRYFTLLDTPKGRYYTVSPVHESPAYSSEPHISFSIHQQWIIHIIVWMMCLPLLNRCRTPLCTRKGAGRYTLTTSMRVHNWLSWTFFMSCTIDQQ